MNQERNQRTRLIGHQYFAEDSMLSAFKEFDPSTIPLGRIPRCHLHKTQPNGEFRKQSREHIEELYERLGLKVLELYPLFVTAVPISLQYPLDQINSEIPFYLTIIDGHHRERYYPKNLPNVPFQCRIFTVAQTVQLYRTSSISTNLNSQSTMEFFETLNNWRIEALKSLTDTVPFYNPPGSTKLLLSPSGLWIPQSK
jgi:hypothetical protein